MKLLITGAAGYLATEVTRQLAERGHQLRLADIREMETEHEFVKCDVINTLVEVEPNRLLMVYDRIPFGWNPVPRGSDERSRVFVFPMRIECT